MTTIGDTCFSYYVQLSDFGCAHSYDRMCKLRRDLTDYIENNFDISQKPWSDLPFKASKAELIHQHSLCQERVSEEYYGDDNTIHIFSAMENLKFLVLKIHEGSHQAFGEDKVTGARYFLVFDSSIKHWSATVQGTFHDKVNPVYFSNPNCEQYGFLDSFAVAPTSGHFRYTSKQHFMGLFSSIEQLFNFIMAEHFTDWDRAAEILKADSPFDAERLGKIIRIRSLNGMTGEVTTIRHAYNSNEWWKQAPSAMFKALTAKFHGNEVLTKRLLATFPNDLAKSSQSSVRWGIGLSHTEATLGMEWRGDNLLGQELMNLRAKLFQAQIHEPCMGNYDTQSEVPTSKEVVTSELLAVAVGDQGNYRKYKAKQLRDGDLHLAALLFMPRSHEQQAALFGNDKWGSILPTEQMGAPLEDLKAIFIANEVSFIGEKRVRPTADANTHAAKKPAAGFTGCRTCVTCMAMRDDECTICGTCCFCCQCTPRKQFAQNHDYAGCAAEYVAEYNQMCEGQLHLEVPLDEPAVTQSVPSDPDPLNQHVVNAVLVAPGVARLVTEPGVAQLITSGPECKPFSSSGMHSGGVPSEAVPMAVDVPAAVALSPQDVVAQFLPMRNIPVGSTPKPSDSLAPSGPQSADEPSPQPSSQPAAAPSAHVSGALILQPSAQHAESIVAPEDSPMTSPTYSPVDNSASDGGNSPVAGVHTSTCVEDEDFFDAAEGYFCEACKTEFIEMDTLLSHDCNASGNTTIHPPDEQPSDALSSQPADAPSGQPSSQPSEVPSTHPPDAPTSQPCARIPDAPGVPDPGLSDDLGDVDPEPPLCTYQVIYGQLANAAPTCNVGDRPIAVDGVLVSNHTDPAVPHWATTPDGASQDPDHVICERCGSFFNLERLLRHCCSMDTVNIRHRLPSSGISNPPVSLPLVNNEIAFVFSNPPSKDPKVKTEPCIENDSDLQTVTVVSSTCKVCGLAVDLHKVETYKLGCDVFCCVACKSIEDSRVSALRMGPAVIALSEQNPDQAEQTARTLEVRLGQVQADVTGGAPMCWRPNIYGINAQIPFPKMCAVSNSTPGHAHYDFFGADPPGFLEHITAAENRHYFSDGVLHMVELFAGVGAFGTGWRRLGNTVIGLCEWNETLTALLLERNPGAVFGTDFNTVQFHAWRSLFDENSQRVHCTAGGPECTPFSAVGKEGGSSDKRANQITGMADASRVLGSCVCVIENVPNIEDHDFTVVIQYFRSKDYHMVCNHYVEHVINGGSTIRKRVFPTFEDGHMASIMPPVGMTNTRLPVYNRVNDSNAVTGEAPACCNGNHYALAKYLMPVTEVPKWLHVHGDYAFDGVPGDADLQDCQRIGFLWFGEPKLRPSFDDLKEGLRVKMDFDENIWVIFSIEPLTGRLKVFKDDRKSPQYREVGRRRQRLTVKNVREILAHRIPVYSIYFPCLTIRKFRVPPAFNGALIADDRSGEVIVRRMSGLELWRLMQLPVADAQLLLNSGIEELELGSLAGNSIPATMLQPELYSVDQRVRQFSALVDASPDFFQWIHVAAPAVDMPITIDFVVIINTCEGGPAPIVPVGEERALWCSTLEALPGRVLRVTDSRDSAVAWGEHVATRMLGGIHEGMLAAEYSKFKVTIRIVVVPTCSPDLALEYNEFEADWFNIQDSKGSKLWDIVSVAYARVSSHGQAPTDASPWIDAAAGEDQV